jgi:hypothetical protein
MVKNDGGQLYTIEGFAAALIMVMTAYLVVNATSVYTAGDTHINDMQLEALGSDALNMMDIAPNSSDTQTPLQEIITYTPTNAENATFNTIFRDYTNRVGAGPNHDILFIANYTCRNSDNTTSIYPLASIPLRPLSGGEHTVKATKWVIVNKRVCDSGVVQNRAVLVEVLLWRD